MGTFRSFCLWIFVGALGALAGLADGAVSTEAEDLQRSSGRVTQIVFRAKVVPSGPVVEFGDIAELRGFSPEAATRLGGQELFPAPRNAEGMLISRQEVLEQLMRRGWNIQEFSVGGAWQVRIYGQSEVAKGEDGVGGSPAAVLGLGIGGNRHHLTPGNTSSISRGGMQEGTMGAPKSQGDSLAPSKRRTRPLVEKGQLVNVVVYGSSVSIHTMGRARQDGELGDWVLVEAFGSRATYRARVSGPQTVTVLVGGQETNRSPVEQENLN